MRYFIPQCRYCKYKKEDCKTFLEIRNLFKSLSIKSISSTNIKCKDFEPIAKVGDLIEFEMCGNIITRPVFYVENKYRTFIVLTARNRRNKDLFTVTNYDYRGDEHYKKYYSDEEHYNIKNNLMLGFVNYKYIKRVVKNVKIPSMEWEKNNYDAVMNFLNKGVKNGK